MKNFLFSFLLVLSFLLSSCEARVKGVKQQQNRKKKRVLAFVRDVNAVSKQQNDLSTSDFKQMLTHVVTKYDDILNIQSIHTDHGVRHLLFWDELFSLDLGSILGDLDLGDLDLGDLNLDDLDLDAQGILDILQTIFSAFGVAAEEDAEEGGSTFEPTDNIVAVPEGSTIKTTTVTTHTITTPEGQVTTLTETSEGEQMAKIESEGTQFVSFTGGAKGGGAAKAKKFGKRHF